MIMSRSLMIMFPRPRAGPAVIGTAIRARPRKRADTWGADSERGNWKFPFAPPSPAEESRAYEGSRPMTRAWKDITMSVILTERAGGRERMSGTDVARARKARGWKQRDLAKRLGVSQPYVSLLERNRRVVPHRLALRLTQVLSLSPSTLPLGSAKQALVSRRAASALGRVGYPGFAYLRGGHALNPAELLVRTLSAENLDARLVEALPWVAD